MVQTDFATRVEDLVGPWKVDTAHTVLEFSAKHMMIATVRGRFDDFSGSFTIDPDASTSSAELTIQATSISTNNPDRDTHLRSVDFFDVENYPTITFRSTGVELISERDGTFRLKGDLTIKGIARPVALQGRFEGVMSKDLFGSPRVAFSLSGSINRKDWDLTWNRAIETGGVLVGDRINLSIDVAAVSQS